MNNDTKAKFAAILAAQLAQATQASQRKQSSQPSAPSKATRPLPQRAAPMPRPQPVQVAPPPDVELSDVTIDDLLGNTPAIPSPNLLLVRYSKKALAMFGDTKLVKDQLKAAGGKFCTYLTWEGKKQAGWVFYYSEKVETDLRTQFNLNV